MIGERRGEILVESRAGVSGPFAVRILHETPCYYGIEYLVDAPNRRAIVGDRRRVLKRSVRNVYEVGQASTADISYEQYDAIWAVRSTLLKSALVSAMQFDYDLRHERADKAHYVKGRALHCLLLEPEEYSARFSVFPRDEGKARTGKAYKEWAALPENVGRQHLLESESDLVHGMARGVWSNPRTAEVIARGLREQTLTWIDERTGLPCKARVDLVNGRLADLKSTSFLVPRRFSKQAGDLGYHFSLAFYEAGCRANGIELDGDPLLVAVDTTPPHDAVVFSLEAPAMALGREQVRDALAVVKYARDRGEWLGMAHDEIVPIDLPAYHYPQEVDEYMIGGEAVSL